MIPGEPSRTARWVAFARGLAHLEYRPVSEDRLAISLLSPPWSTMLRVAEAAPPLTMAALGTVDFFSRGRSRFMSFRTRVIDDAVTTAVAEGALQIVILGAGLDARAWRLPATAGCTVFEVDHPDTQGYKRDRIGERAPLAAEVRYVPVDFERDSLSERLAASGFNASQKSVVIWEGVVMYLPSEAVDATLSTLRSLLADGSHLVLSYSRRGARFTAAEREVVGLIVGAAGEKFRLQEEPNEMAERLARAGFGVDWDEGHPDWAPRLLQREQPWDLQRILVARPGTGERRG